MNERSARRGTWLTTNLAVGLALLFVVSGALSGVALAAGASSVHSGSALPNASASAAPSAASLTNPSTTVAATEQAFIAAHTDPTLLSYLSRISPQTVSSVWTALLSGDKAALGQILVPASGAACGTGGLWCISDGLATVAVLGCAYSAAGTLGLGCLAIGIAIIAILIYELYFGESAASEIGKQVEDLSITLVDDIDTDFQLTALGVVNQVSALNETVNALGYEGAAAALSQLGNATFNEPLDLAQSGIAAQLAGVLSAQMATISQLTGQFMATASEELGSANSESFSCSLGIASIYNPLDGSGHAISCPSAAPGSYTYNNGILSSGIAYGSGSATTYLWLNQSDPISIETGTATTIELVPMNGAHPFYNLTGSAATTKLVNFSGPTGAYHAIWTTGTDEILPAISMPLSSSDFSTPTTAVEQYFLNQSGANQIFAGGQVTISGLSCSGLFTCGTTEGDTAGAESSQLAPEYLFNLEASAETQAEVYWLTLRDLGYTSASEVPARCLIPSPAQLLPQDLTPTQLASLNATAMLRIYYALLANLAYTFNASSKITAFNVCGHHVTLPTGGSPVGFGTYAYAYLYVPNATGWGVPSGGGPVAPTYSLTALASTASANGLTSPSFVVAKKQTLVVLAESLNAVPTVTDGAGNTLTLLYTAPSTGGGATALYVDNQTTAASGTDTVVSAWTGSASAGTLAVFTYNASGVGTRAWGSSTFYNGAATLLTTNSWTVPSNSITTAVLLATGAAVDNSTFPVGATRESVFNAGAVPSLNASLVPLTAGLHPVSYGVKTLGGFALVIGWSVTGSAPPTGPVSGPQVYANPETWNTSGIISFAPAIATWAPSIGSAWQLPDSNPSFATVQPFTTNVTNPSSGYGYVNTIGPTQCVTGGVGSPQNCSIDTSPLFLLDYIGGNSSANIGISGSVFPTHEDGSGAGYSVFVTECFVAQKGATAANVTYTPVTTGICSFDHNTINSTAYVVCSDGTYAFNISSCPTPPPVLTITPANGCGGPYLNWIAGPIASGLSGVPILGGIACGLGEIVAIGAIVLIAAVSIYAIVKITAWIIERRNGDD